MTEHMDPGQQLMMRGSLPLNVSAQQLMVRQGSGQQNYGQQQVQQQATQQVANNQRQFQVMPSSPQLRQQQFVSHQQGATMVQRIPPQPHQQVRVPHHVPQSLAPVKNIQS